MSSVELSPHPATPCAAIRRVYAQAQRLAGDRLRLEFVAEGDVASLLVPQRHVGGRCDGLWQHTCCEAFLRRDGSAGYYELNLAPSTDWAIYGFRAYRELATLVDDAQVLSIVSSADAARLLLSVEVDLARLDASFVGVALEIGLSAVLEERSSTLSYWSLHHPPGEADFHHRDAFVVQL